MEFNKYFNPGAYPDRLDERDREYGEIVFGTPEIDWKKGYDVERALGIKLKVEHQDGSSSCVGQAWAKYTEVIDFVETGEILDHSAKSIYEQIYLPDGGAYIREGAKAIVKGGVALEDWVSSYEDGLPPSEQYMRISSITPETREKMKVYQAKEYRSIGPANPDLIAHAIMNNYGAVSGARGDGKGWSGKNKDNFIVNPPVSSDPWGHAYYFLAFGKDERGRWFEFLNSWGEKWGNSGRGRMYYDDYDMASNTFGVWTLVDLPNIMQSNVKIIKDKNSPTCGIWLPATTEEALKSYCLNFGLEVPKKEDGSIDWDEWIQGILELK